MIPETVTEINHHVHTGRFMIDPSLEAHYNMNGAKLYAVFKLENFLAPIQPDNYTVPRMNKPCEHCGTFLYPA